MKAGERGGNVDRRDRYGSTALHAAAAANRPAAAAALLRRGADPDLRDGESGWTALHKALYYGHLRVAAQLLRAGASVAAEDHLGRTPLDLLARELRPLVDSAAGGEVVAWGSGANFQLGTGSTGVQALPARVEALSAVPVRQISAAKFHSAALTVDGRLYTWGFGRGGRLGHPDFHGGGGGSANRQVAVIEPRQVAALAHCRVVAVSAAKHHTAAVTDRGRVFTWGSNRDGRLGYAGVDTQPIPKKVGGLKGLAAVEVATANKHTAVVVASGEVYTWGGNAHGQLGYGTSGSSFSCAPRAVEALHPKRFAKVAAAKKHTVALCADDGQVWTWGYKAVMPRRVMLDPGQDVKAVQFHRG